MPKLSTLIADEEPFEVRTESGQILVSGRWRPGVYTSKLSDEARENNGGVAWMLSKLVLQWDITDDEGIMIPLTVEALANIPIRVLNTVLDSLTRSLLPNQTKSENTGSFV